MSQYSDNNFNTQQYADARPTYPKEFYEVILSKVKDRDLAVDLGCGTGIVTFAIAPYFKKTYGTDPSDAMIRQCNQKPIDNVEFIQGTGEAFPTQISPGSVDLITAGECAHWMNHDVFYKECHRMLKPGGTLAFWLYKDPVFESPRANAIYHKYTWESSFDHNTDADFEQYMGPYYQQPGHNYLGTLLKEKPVPLDLYTDIERVEYLLDDHQRPTKLASTPLHIRKDVTVRWFLEYVKSWSAYHSWMKDHGDKYDVAEAFTHELMHDMGWNLDSPITLEFETMYTTAHKKP